MDLGSCRRIRGLPRCERRPTQRPRREVAATAEPPKALEFDARELDLALRDDAITHRTAGASATRRRRRNRQLESPPSGASAMLSQYFSRI